MPRRKSWFRLSLKRGSFVSISAVGLLLFSILTFLSFFFQPTSDSFFVQELISRFFGWGSIFLPFILAMAGLLLLRSRPRFITLNLFVGSTLFALSFLSLSHLVFLRGRDAYDLAKLGQGGGIIGYHLNFWLQRYFSSLGAFFVILAAMVVSLLVIFNASLEDLIKGVARFWERLSSIFRLAAFFKSGNQGQTRKGETTGAEGNVAEKEPGREEKVNAKAFPQVEVLPLPVEPAGVPLAVAEAPKTAVRPAEEVARQETVKNETVSQIWEYPPLSLLSEVKLTEANRGDVAKNAATIEKTLDSFGIKARVVEINLGPAVTQYALESAQGTKIAKIKNLQNDLALALASPTGTVRIEAPIPGKSLVGVEVPNLSPSLVTLKSILTVESMKSGKGRLLVALGLDVSGSPLVADVKKMPHVLIAGSTGSGKSTLIHAFLATWLFRCSPEELRLILVDTKRVELTEYNEIPHLLTPVITEPEKVLSALKWSTGEMERRYKLFQGAKVRDIEAYNELSGFQALPYIVILVDELADMMQLAPVEVEKTVCRLAQMSRATGIHLVLSTQRPSVDVLTGLIKANIPCRIAFNVTSQVDSRVIIDQTGAEKLLGRGDMLYLPADSSKPMRIQGVYVHPAELRSLLDFVRSRRQVPIYESEVTEGSLTKGGDLASDDELFAEAVRVICEYDRASASLLQRRLKIGYARAARLLDEMEGKNIVGRADGSKPREVLIHDPDSVLANAS